MSIINRKISIKCQTPKHLTNLYLLSLLPESESAKLVMAIMVMIFIVVMLAMVIRTDRKNRTTRTSETGTTDPTSKFDFLCKAAFAILVMFYTW